VCFRLVVGRWLIVRAESGVNFTLRLELRAEHGTGRRNLTSDRAIQADASTPMIGCESTLH
jgi:hypothetical protein